jgi:hypothetical protein
MCLSGITPPAVCAYQARPHLRRLRQVTTRSSTGCGSQVQCPNKIVVDRRKVKAEEWRPTQSHAGPDDIVQEEDYVDVIRVSKAPDEAYIQTLEQQHLAVCHFLEIHFIFLLEGLETQHYSTNSIFLNGDVIRGN